MAILNVARIHLGLFVINKLFVIVVLQGCAGWIKQVTAQEFIAARAESLVFTIIDFRVPALRATFAEALRRELAAHSSTAKIREINFVSCELSVRAIDECVAEAIATKPTLIYATTTLIALHARRANSEISIIFSGTADPRQVGLVERLDRHFSCFWLFLILSCSRSDRPEKQCDSQWMLVEQF